MPTGRCDRQTTIRIIIENRKQKAPPDKPAVFQHNRKTKCRKHRGKSKHNKKQFEAAAAICGTGSVDIFYQLVSLVPRCLVCRLLPVFINRSYFTTVAPPHYIPAPLDATQNECMALPTKCHHVFVPPDHRPFACFEEPPVPTCSLTLLQRSTPRSQYQTPAASVPWTPPWLLTLWGRPLGISTKSSNVPHASAPPP